MRSLLKIRQLASAIAHRARMAATAGLTFGGSRDLYQELGYDREIKPIMYRNRYERNGLATTIVDAYPKATWRGMPELIENDDPEDETEFEKAWTEFQERLQVWSVLRDADVLAGQGHYAVVLIGAPGRFEDELPPTLTLDSIAYLTPYSEEDMTILTYDEDTASPRFGHPVEYQLRRAATATRSALAPRVHWTRVLHIAEGALSDKVFGEPRLRKVWNWLDDLEKVTGGGSEAFWRRVHQGMHIDLDAEDDLDEGEIKKLEDESDAMVHGMRRILATRKSKVNMLGSDVSPFNNQVEALLTLISGSTGIPKRILVGSERGELASTQDRENWNDRVGDRQKQFADPFIIRPLIKVLIDHGALPKPESYEVRWPKAGSMTEAQKVDVASKASSLPEDVITHAEVRDQYLGLPPLEDPEENKDPLSRDDMTEDENDELLQESGVRQASQRTSYKRLHDVADRNRGKVRNVILRASERARRELSMDELERALSTAESSGRLTEVDNAIAMSMITLERELQKNLPVALLTTLNASGTASARAATVKGFRSAKISIGFDRGNQRSAKWAEKQSAKTVTNVTRETKKAIRSLVTRGFTEQRTPFATARDIRGLIGLTSGQEASLAKFRSALRKAEPGQIVRAGKNVVRIPKSGVSSDLVNKWSSKYEQQLIRYRAETIARTETIAASNEGQRQLWLQAQEQGLLKITAKRKWIVTDDDALDEEICAPMAGEAVAIDEEFELPDGSRVMGPPAHPRCRCAVGLE